MQHFFGIIENNEMQLSPVGCIVRDEWLKTPIIRADMNLILDSFVVMPNHFHAIIIIGGNMYNDGSKEGLNSGKDLAAIIRGFKGAVTAKARLIDSSFRWKERYHDHIIRNAEAHYNIGNYIVNNPVNWQNDCFISRSNC